MIDHIATPRRRFAAEGGPTPGAQAPGPTQNAIGQGQCVHDIGMGVVNAAMNSFAGIAGAVAGSLATGSLAAAVGALTAGAITAATAGVNAFNNSQACQELDNPAQANALGLGAIGAP